MANVTVTGGAMEEKERQAYWDHVQQENPKRKIQSLKIEVDGDYVNLSYQLVPVKFDRIRRITGYLVGNMDRWNNAKRAEEHDRVKHDATPALHAVVSAEARQEALNARSEVESCSCCNERRTVYQNEIV